MQRFSFSNHEIPFFKTEVFPLLADSTLSSGYIVIPLRSKKAPAILFITCHTAEAPEVEPRGSFCCRQKNDSSGRSPNWLLPRFFMDKAGPHSRRHAISQDLIQVQQGKRYAGEERPETEGLFAAPESVQRTQAAAEKHGNEPRGLQPQRGEAKALDVEIQL